ncbi:MAG: DUF819 family protein [Anaerofustis sp.]
MLMSVLMILAICFLPRLTVLATAKVPMLNTLGSVFLCYLGGLILSFAFKAGGADMSLASDLSSVLVCIAMPLILFSADLPALKKLAKPMLISYAMNVVAVLIMAFLAFFLFRGIVQNADLASAMLIGDYTGGTPNLFAIGKSLGADNDQILLLQTSDMIGGGIYFFILISLMPVITRKLLPHYVPVGHEVNYGETAHYESEFSGEKRSIKPWRSFLNRVLLVLLSLCCVAVAMGVALLLPSKFGNVGLAKLSEFMAVIMLVLTTLGIALSFVKKVRSSTDSYSTGQYFILMFSVAMGLCFDFSAMSTALGVFAMLMLVQFGTVILHLIMAKIGKIDDQTMLITSTAGIYGPAFIIPVANALKNEEIVLPGILCGILGYAIGNYLGIAFGGLFSLL